MRKKESRRRNHQFADREILEIGCSKRADV